MFIPQAPSKDRRWRWFLRLLLLVVLLAAGWGGSRGYRVWNQRHLIHQAREFLEKEDLSSAILSARQALRVNARDVEAARLMAEIAEKVSSPEAILWRGRVVELQSKDPANRVIWARTALRFGETAVANQALMGVPPAGQRTAAYHQVAAALALSFQQTGLAEAHFLRAAQLEPGNLLTQLNLATIRLQSSDRQVAQAARATLEKLRAIPSLHLEALRTLLADALAHQENKRALAMARDLHSDPSAIFRDHILYLGVLQRLKHPGFASCLQQLQTQAAERGGDIYEMLLWMNANGMASQALTWAGSLSPKTQALQVVTLGMAESCVAAGNWNKLRRITEPSIWPGLDFLRLTFLTQALIQTDHPVAARVRWRGAVSAAGGLSEAILMMTRLTQAWGMNSETEELCWLLSKDPRWTRWSLLTLYRIYDARRNTRELLKVVSRAVEWNPSDRAARNNMALLSLLLKVNISAASRIASELHAEEPSNPAYLSTYAFSLHVQGQTEKAIQTLEVLKPGQLEDPPLAAYYGIMLAAKGDATRAPKYLALATRARLLPEEEALLEKARLSIHRP